ncbi:MAG: hypothetical protein GY772_10770 [bacterium]|nr:hypothetical protein [bacterium]
MSLFPARMVNYNKDDPLHSWWVLRQQIEDNGCVVKLRAPHPNKNLSRLTIKGPGAFDQFKWLWRISKAALPDIDWQAVQPVVVDNDEKERVTSAPPPKPHLHPPTVVIVVAPFPQGRAGGP